MAYHRGIILRLIIGSWLCSCALLAEIGYATPQKITVILDWLINPNHAPLFVAEQEGFFAQQGLQIRWITPADPTEGEKLVAARKAELAITYQPAWEIGRQRGLPLARIATLIKSPLSCLVVLADSDIHHLGQLRGKRIGYSSALADQLILATLLKQAKLTPTDLHLINVKFNLVSALLSGQIDGFIGGMRNQEPLLIQNLGKAVRTFLPEQFGFPNYAELILITNSQQVTAPFIPKFITALQQGVQYLKAHPEDCWRKFAQHHPTAADELSKQIWLKTLPYFADDPRAFNSQHDRQLVNFLKNTAF